MLTFNRPDPSVPGKFWDSSQNPSVYVNDDSITPKEGACASGKIAAYVNVNLVPNVLTICPNAFAGRFPTNPPVTYKPDLSTFRNNPDRCGPLEHIDDFGSVSGTLLHELTHLLNAQHSKSSRSLYLYRR